MTPRRSVQGGACYWPDSRGCALSKLDCDDPTNFRSIRQINLFSNHGSRCRWQQAVKGNELGKCSNDDDGVLTTPTPTPTQCATDVGSCPNGSSWDPEPECTVETTSFGRCTNSTGDPGMCAWSHEHCSHEDNDNDSDNNNNNTNTNTTLWLPFEEGCTCDQVQVGGCGLLKDNGELQLFCSVSEDACDDEQSWIKPREVKTAAGYDCFLCREVRIHEVPADSPIDTDDLINSTTTTTTTTTTVPPIFSESQNASTISAVGGVTTIIISLILGAILALVIVGLVLWRVFRTKRDIKRAVEGEKEIPPPATAIEIDSTIMMDNASVLSDDDYDYEVAPSISTSSRASGKLSKWRTMSHAIRAKMKNSSEDAATPTIAYENVTDKSSPVEEPQKPAEAEATKNAEASSAPAEMEHSDTMPEGWSETTDPSTQQVYYYNSISRQTAWERPTKAEPPAMEEPEIAAEQTTTEVGPPEEEPTSPAAAAPEEEATTKVPPSAEEEISSLPEGWVEMTDPSTQQVCYYNSISEETAWERPTMEEPPAMEEQISKPSDEPEIAIEQTAAEELESSTEAASTSPAEIEVPIMPEGWEEVTDPATTQQVYYYNVLSGETAWERPLVPSASTADSAPDKETNDNDATPEIVVDENE